jgi:hypothetical protein
VCSLADPFCSVIAKTAHRVFLYSGFECHAKFMGSLKIMEVSLDFGVLDKSRGACFGSVFRNGRRFLLC